VSFSAGLASVAFYEHIKQERYDAAVAADTKIVTFLKQHRPYFDSRIFSLPNNGEVLNNILWRHKFDYRRNSIAQLARHYFKPKDLERLHSGQLLEKMKNEKKCGLGK